MMRGLTVVMALLVGACASEGGVDAGELADMTDAFDASIETDSGDAAATSCPPGHVLGPSGDCMAVGIQGCADMFIDPDSGLCEPKPEDCPPGQIPDFSQGCRSVGVPDCHPDFIHPESGLCEPSLDLCAEGFIPVPTQGCVSLDPPGGCGEGTWGHIQEQEGDVHVDVNYAGGDSDGSRAKPWTLISDALEHIERRARIVLAAGEYEEGVDLATTYDDEYQPEVESLGLVGRCSSMVSITGAFDGHNGKTVVQIIGVVDSFVSDVTISGPGIGIVVWATSAEMTRVVVDGTHKVGILVPYPISSLVATDILVARTVNSANGGYGRGIEVAEGASLVLERSALVGNNEAIFAGLDGTYLRVNDTFVTYDTGPAEPKSGLGLRLQGALFAHVTNSAIIGTRFAGIHVLGPHTNLLAEDTVVSRTRGPSSTSSWGLGTNITGGANASLEGVALFDNQMVGLLVSGEGTSVVAHRLLVAQTQLGSDETLGVGVQVQYGASFMLDGGSLVENRRTSLAFTSSLTTGVVRNVLVARTRAGGNGSLGRGIVVMNSASVLVDSAAVVGNREAAVAFLAAGGTVTRSLLTDTELGLTWGGGDGLLVTGSVVKVSRVAARGNARAGILFDRSAGELTVSLSKENAVGLVSQGLPGPVIRDDNLVTGNDQNLLDDGDLEIPDEAMELPDTPELD
jgi:hypothetical protein